VFKSQVFLWRDSLVATGQFTRTVNVATVTSMGTRTSQTVVLSRDFKVGFLRAAEWIHCAQSSDDTSMAVSSLSTFEYSYRSMAKDDIFRNNVYLSLNQRQNVVERSKERACLTNLIVIAVLKA
jgi:hypothetical protein